MTTAYSTNLELALPVQGELSGTWGDTVNNGITQYLDTAIAGSQIISGSQTAVTLTNTNGDNTATNIAQAGSGATGTAQYQIIRCTGNPAGLLTITISDTLTAGYSKTFIIINATSTSQSVKIVGSGPTTGITVLSGAKSLVAWNGSDFVEIASSTADGVTTFSAGTTGFTPSSATTGAVTLAGTLATTNGGTGLTSFTSGGVVFASSSSVLATGSGLKFDGTNLGVGITPSAWVDGKALNVGGGRGGSLFVEEVNYGFASLNANCYYSATNTWTYVSSNPASRYNQLNSVHSWYTAASGTAGNAITFTQAMTLDASGNLGIGTSSPSTKLEVVGAIKAAANSSNQLWAAAASGENSAHLRLSPSGASADQRDWSLVTYVAANGDCSLMVGASAGANPNAGTSVLTATRTGNVGIGTTSPVSKLTLDKGNVTGAGQWASSSLAIANPTNTGSYSQIAFGYTIGTTNASAYMGFISTNQGTNGYGDLVFGTRAVNTDTQPTERLRIDSAGNVGIGTSSPTSKLDVNGQINTTNIIAGIRNNITSTDRISVTSATTIFSIATSGSSVGASSAFLLVNGYDTGTTTNSFTDLVLFIGGQTPVVVSTVNRGSPAARTYTASGGSALALAMASGTYNVANSNIEQAC